MLIFDPRTQRQLRPMPANARAVLSSVCSLHATSDHSACNDQPQTGEADFHENDEKLHHPLENFRVTDSKTQTSDVGYFSAESALLLCRSKFPSPMLSTLSYIGERAARRNSSERFFPPALVLVYEQ